LVHSISKFFQSILQLGIQPEMTFVQRRNIQVTNGVALISLLITFPFFIPLVFAKTQTDVIINIVTNLFSSVPALVILYLAKLGRHNAARLLLLFYFMAFLFGLPFFVGHYSGTNMHLATVLLGTILLFENRWLVLLSFTITWFLLVFSNYLFSAPINHLNLEINNPIFILNSLSMGIMFYFAANAFKQESNLYQKQIELTNDELADKNKQIKESIQYAQYIQKSLLPDIAPLQKVFPDSFIFYQPRDVVSGDFYWLQPLPNGLFCVAVADCTGHGVPGALMSMLGLSYLEQIVVERGVHQPNLVLQELDTAIRKSLRQDTTQNQNGLDIGLCLIDQTSQILHFAGAYHPAWLVSSQGQWHELKANRHSIGSKARQENFAFELQTFQYQPDTMLYLFSDGYKDQFGGANNQKFSTKQLKSLLIGLSPLPCGEQAAQVEQGINQWMQAGKEAQIDDISLLGIRLT